MLLERSCRRKVLRRQMHEHALWKTTIKLAINTQICPKQCALCDFGAQFLTDCCQMLVRNFGSDGSLQ